MLLITESGAEPGNCDCVCAHARDRDERDREGEGPRVLCSVFVRVCAFVCERETERQRDRKGEKDLGSLCVLPYAGPGDYLRPGEDSLWLLALEELSPTLPA